MDDALIRFDAPGGEVRLVAEGDGWCRASIVCDGHEMPIGGGREDVIAQRLMRAFASPLDEVGSAEWVLTFGGPFHPVYRYRMGDALCLAIVNGGGKVVFLTQAEPARRQEWVDRLATWMRRHHPLDVAADDRAELAGHPEYMVYQLTRCVPEVVARPLRVFRGLRTIGALRQGVAYCGRPAVRYDNAGDEHGTGDGMLFHVYVSPDGFVFDWDFVREDPARPGYPIDAEKRFAEELPNWPGTTIASLDGLRGRRRGKQQAPAPWYSAKGDCVFCYFSDEPSYAERVTDYLTMYRQFGTDEPTGLKVKNIQQILPMLRASGKVQIAGPCAEVSVLMLLDLVGDEITILRVGPTLGQKWQLLRDRLESSKRAPKVTLPVDPLPAP